MIGGCAESIDATSPTLVARIDTFLLDTGLVRGTVRRASTAICTRDQLVLVVNVHSLDTYKYTVGSGRCVPGDTVHLKCTRVVAECVHTTLSDRQYSQPDKCTLDHDSLACIEHSDRKLQTNYSYSGTALQCRTLQSDSLHHCDIHLGTEKLVKKDSPETFCHSPMHRLFSQIFPKAQT